MEKKIEELDPLLFEAAQIVILNNSPSVSLIQRRLKLGYNRAGRIMDQLEAMEIVGPFLGTGPRKLIVDDISIAKHRIDSTKQL